LDDEKRFATVARVSEINLGLYRTFAAPFVKAMANPQSAEAMRALHPNRLRFAALSDHNPAMAAVKLLAAGARSRRRPVSPDNPWLAAEKAVSSWIRTSLETFGEIRDGLTEAAFMTTYGSPLLQAMVGLGAEKDGRRSIKGDLLRDTTAAELKASLDEKFERGGLEEAALRAAIYVRKPGSGFDERAYRALKLIREKRNLNARLNLSRFREILSGQLQLVSSDEERAVAALPKLIETSPAQAGVALEAIHDLVSAEGALSRDGKARLARVERLFEHT
jgi:hypothetical protein